MDEHAVSFPHLFCGRSYDFICFIFTTALRHALCCLFCCEVTASRNQLGRPLGNFTPKLSSLSGRCQRVHQPSKRWSKHLSRLFWRDWGPSRNSRSCVTSIFWMNTRVFTTRSHNSVDFWRGLSILIFDMWLDIYWGHYLKTNVNEWSRERSSFKKGIGTQ